MKLYKQRVFSVIICLVLLFTQAIPALALSGYSITVSQTEVTMQRGETALVALSLSLPANDSLSIKSSNNAVVSCELSRNTLILRSSNAGKATVTLKALSGNKQDSEVEPVDISVFVDGSYAVSFDTLGGTGSPSAFAVKYGEECTIETVTPTKQGYVFLGWQIGEDTKTVYQSGETYDLTAAYEAGGNQSVVLKAIWQAIPYSVTYHSNTTDSVQDMPQSLPELIYNDEVKIPEKKPARGGYKFLGWGTAADGEAVYKSGDSFKVTKSLNLYALWEKNEVQFSKSALTVNKAKTTTASLDVTIRGTCSYYRISTVKGVTYKWGSRVGNTIPLTVDVTGVAAKKAKVTKTIRIRTYDADKNLIANSAFTVTVKNMKKPTVTAKKNKNGTVKLKWKKVAGATSYRVLCSSTKKFKKPKTITVSKGRTVTLKKNTSGKVYYKVCAVREDYIGLYSKVKSF